MTETDRRILRTRRLLAEALVDLIGEQDYDAITIRGITDRADVGYATFFRHYKGKDDLMLEIFTSIVDELEAMPHQHGERYFQQEGYRLFQHVADHAALYQGILGSQPFARKLREHATGIVRVHLDRHAADITGPLIPLEVAAQHMVSSLLGLIDWWLAYDQPYTAEHMALIYERLIIQGTWHVMNPNNPVYLPWGEEPGETG
jgi:AcrR family transcriptional regulator